MTFSLSAASKALFALAVSFGLTMGSAAAEPPKAFKKCKACHTVDDGGKNKVGPNLWGVAGNAAGAKEGFKYSKALQEAAAGGLVWDDASLDSFLLKPKKFIKKTKMSFAGLKKEEDRVAIIDYLKSLQ